MKNLFYIIAVLVSVVLAFLLGASWPGYLCFVLASISGAFIAERLNQGSEWIFWGVALGTLLLITISNYGADFHRLLIILPLIFLLGYSVARLTIRFTNRTRI